MTGKSGPERIGIFGGTFDPIHYGHLRMAIEIKRRLALDEMHLMLSARPPHRHPPSASKEHRWAMLQLAVQEFPQLLADDRELRRAGPSYSVDSAADLKAEFGTDCKLALCVGWDSMLTLPSWHRWRDLMAMVCIVAVNRPHSESSGEGMSDELRSLLCPENQQALLAEGSIVSLQVEPVEVSATQIRNQLAQDQKISESQVPEAVLTYIYMHKLYQT